MFATVNNEAVNNDAVNEAIEKQSTSKRQLTIWVYSCKFDKSRLKRLVQENKIQVRKRQEKRSVEDFICIHVLATLN